ncbi:PE-PPE domain-containing protein [Tsukamurella strandjordii]|uniref:PE-PPE domain-containing protein n=1 Tax=Tsukamurella strandjordii TaxID=147577 RepID=UPI0031CF503C
MTHLAIAVPGTWEGDIAWNSGVIPGPRKAVGLLKLVTDNLNRATWDVIYCNYPGSFGPVAGGGTPPFDAITRPSYAESVQIGVNDVIGIINNNPGRKFALLGYSQGGEVISRVAERILRGDMQHRKNDILFGHTFGNPCRGYQRTFDKGAIQPGSGISKFNLHDTGPIDWFDYVNPGDMYSSVMHPDSYIDEVYEPATHLGINPTEIAQFIVTGLNDQSIVQKIIRDGISDPLGTAVRLAASVTQAAIFFGQGTGPHISYHTAPIIGNLTAIQHSTNHLNYWGARR